MGTGRLGGVRGPALDGSAGWGAPVCGCGGAGRGVRGGGVRAGSPHARRYGGGLPAVGRPGGGAGCPAVGDAARPDGWPARGRWPPGTHRWPRRGRPGSSPRIMWMRSPVASARCTRMRWPRSSRSWPAGGGSSPLRGWPGSCARRSGCCIRPQIRTPTRPVRMSPGRCRSPCWGLGGPDRGAAPGGGGGGDRRGGGVCRTAAHPGRPRSRVRAAGRRPGRPGQRRPRHRIVPTRGGLPVSVSVTVDTTALGDQVWTTSLGHTLTDAERRFTMCDAMVTPIEIDPGGCPDPIADLLTPGGPGTGSPSAGRGSRPWPPPCWVPGSRCQWGAPPGLPRGPSVGRWLPATRGASSPAVGSPPRRARPTTSRIGRPAGHRTCRIWPCSGCRMNC